ncbi:hypothetical protein LTR16_012472, partial [Cryomyces antarcticus]
MAREAAAVRVEGSVPALALGDDGYGYGAAADEAGERADDAALLDAARSVPGDTRADDAAIDPYADSEADALPVVTPGADAPPPAAGAPEPPVAAGQADPPNVPSVVFAIVVTNLPGSGNTTSAV